MPDASILMCECACRNFCIYLREIALDSFSVLALYRAVHARSRKVM
jgi:hypothetical protein